MSVIFYNHKIFLGTDTTQKKYDYYFTLKIDTAGSLFRSDFYDMKMVWDFCRYRRNDSRSSSDTDKLFWVLSVLYLRKQWSQ